MTQANSRTIEIWADSEGRSTCRARACQQPILWGEIVKGGKRMCFNGDAVPVRTRHDDATRRLINVYDFADNHWAACKDAGSFKR